MLEKIANGKVIWDWRWPLIVIAVLALIVGIQMLRVNKPEPVAPETSAYTARGFLTSGDVLIPAAGYHSIRIDLNRRARVSGVFRTPDVKSRVSVLVLSEANFDNWKLGEDFVPITQTGYVPGGKISPVLEAGSYFLVIDNRRNDTAQKVRAEFELE